MATRNPRRRCRNCPETKDGLPPPSFTVKSQSKLAATAFGREVEKLWQFAVYACSTSMELLGGYVAMDVPGDVLPVLKRLHARLGEIIQTREERIRETSGPSK
jgi:hypothetical protein